MLSFFPLDISFVKYQVIICVWVHFWVFSSIPLIFLPVSVPIPCSFYHYCSKPRHYCGCQEVHVDRSPIKLSPERPCQSLTNDWQKLKANHWTECGIPNRGVIEKTEGVEGVWNPIGRTTISTNQTSPPPQSSQGLNHQPKNTHGGTHGSICICSRRWPYLASIGGETLGPVKAWCPRVGEC